MSKNPFRAIFSFCILYTAIVGLAQAQPLLAPSSSGGLLADPVQTRVETQPPGQGGQSQQLMKEARVELGRAALVLERADAADLNEAVLVAREALVQFEQSLDQLQQSVPGYVPLELATSLMMQVAATEDLLDSDPVLAAHDMHELTLRVTDLTAEADLLVGRVLLDSAGEKIGNVSNVLITADGRIQALIVDRMGRRSDTQFVVEWSSVVVEGPNLIAAVAGRDTPDLPDYLAE